MTQPNPSTAMARSVIDELIRGGCKLFVISPGSRSAALAIAASEHQGAETRVVLDERSAAYHALGRAKTSGAPAAVIATSGTAPANYLPAVVEADLSLAPLILISADRPAEMRGVGANQTIDQVNLYGDRVRMFADIASPGSGGADDLNEYWRTVASGSVSASLGLSGRPGPVHINIAFREPTVPATNDGRTVGAKYPFSIEGRDNGARWFTREGLDPDPVELGLDYHPQGVVIAGEGVYDRKELLGVAADLAWPVLATAQSRIRGEKVVSSYHHLFANGVPPSLNPEVVYAVGAIGPSQRLEDLVSAANVRIRVDYWGRHIDPRRNATHIVRADPATALAQLGPAPAGDRAWVDGWIDADRRIRDALAKVMDEQTSSTGPAIARSLNESGWETLVVSSSLPIREVDAHLTRSGDVIANRGASGIDGFVSTALGVSSTGRRTIALTGDLGLLHDSNGFLTDSDDDLVIVVVDNDGGGLFDRLPPAQHAPAYERLFVAPQRRDLKQFSRFHNLAYHEVRHVAQLAHLVDDRLAVGGLSLIRVPVARDVDLELSRRMDDAATTAVGLLDA